MGSRGTKPGALFTPVTDEIRQAIREVTTPNLSRFCRDRKISFDTVQQIIQGQTRYVSDDVLKRIGLLDQFQSAEWKPKIEWKGLGLTRRGQQMPLRQGKYGVEKRCNGRKHRGAYVLL